MRFTTTAQDHILRVSSYYLPVPSYSATADYRTGTTTITYENNSTRIATIKDPLGTIQHKYTYDTATGRLIKDETPQGDSSSTKLASNYAYNTRGQLTGVSGDVPYRVTYTYDNTYGDRLSQTTYRTSSGDTTTFACDPATGVLLERKDAAQQSTKYTYTALGQLATRTWPGLNTCYGPRCHRKKCRFCAEVPS